MCNFDWRKRRFNLCDIKYNILCLVRYVCMNVSASPAVAHTQYVTLQKYFSHPRFGYLLFCNPTYETETGTQQIGRGTSNSKPPGPIITMAQSEHWASVRSYLLHSSFLQVHSAAVSFTSHPEPCNYADPKPFSWAKPAHFGFSSSNFTLQDHSYT